MDVEAVFKDLGACTPNDSSLFLFYVLLHNLAWLQNIK